MGVLTTYKHTWFFQHIGDGAFEMSPAIPWNAPSSDNTVSVTEVRAAL